MVWVSFWETLQETKQERENCGPAVWALTAVWRRKLGLDGAGPGVRAFTTVCGFEGKLGLAGDRRGQVRSPGLLSVVFFCLPTFLFVESLSER